eukprot:757381-Hanusia_phi.AAC.9
MQVRVEGGDPERAEEAVGVEASLERDVVLDGRALDPAGLGGEGDGARGANFAADSRDLLQDGREEGRLAAAHLACDDDKLTLAHSQVDVLQRWLPLLVLYRVKLLLHLP